MADNPDFPAERFRHPIICRRKFTHYALTDRKPDRRAAFAALGFEWTRDIELAPLAERIIQIILDKISAGDFKARYTRDHPDGYGQLWALSILVEEAGDRSGSLETHWLVLASSEQQAHLTTIWARVLK